jgi:hypothetical protein
LPRTAFRSATLLYRGLDAMDPRRRADRCGAVARSGRLRPRALPSNRSLTALAARYAENTRWGVNAVYEIDVTEPVRAVLARFARPSAIALIAAGQGTPWGRKFFATGGAPPSLKLTFEDPPAPPPSPAVSTERGAPSAATPVPSSAAAM